MWRRIGMSWLGLKTWVKVWLFFLNGVFLAALCFLEDPLAIWTLAAYVASGQLLVSMMRRQRGLTRLLGLAHLVPWVPLLVYVGARLGSAAAGPTITYDRSPELFAYALLLFSCVAVCLAFDVVDVLRWLGGQRFVIGSREAFEAGASRLTLDDQRPAT